MVKTGELDISNQIIYLDPVRKGGELPVQAPIFIEKIVGTFAANDRRPHITRIHLTCKKRVLVNM